MLYIAQVVCYTGILYAIYMLLLRNRPIHTFNRAYLLLASLLPLLLPFIKLPSLATYWQRNEVMNFRLPEITVGGNIAPHVRNTVDVALIIYTAVACLLLIVMAVKYIRLQRMARRSEQQPYKGYTLLLNTGYGPGSWGRYIVLPDAEAHETVIEHEAAHLRMRHSADLLLINLLQCIVWPNLFLYAIKKELRQVHEFQADAAIDVDAKTYGELLLSNTFSTCTLPFTHSFNIHPLKRRIMMLKKRKSPLAIVFGVAALFAAGIVVFNVVALQSCKAKKWEVMKAGEVDKMPLFKGDYQDFLFRTLNYPQEAIDNNIEGKVDIGFIVDENGKIKDVQVKTKDANPILSKEAKRVVEKMEILKPAEKNGKKVAVELILPINFKLPDSIPPSPIFFIDEPSPEHTVMNCEPVEIATTKSDKWKQKSYQKEIQNISEYYDEVQREQLSKLEDNLSKHLQELSKNKKEIEKQQQELQKQQQEVEAEIERFKKEQNKRK
ncbi:hypothetical protein CAP35_12010 [Chitinophagaceae bacterium IBVUCB1]|nr:hypothetical protein CAP35_12010 [Chitinophagaceae bacterium IBVUCB1]